MLGNFSPCHHSTQVDEMERKLQKMQCRIDALQNQALQQQDMELGFNIDPPFTKKIKDEPLPPRFKIS